MGYDIGLWYRDETPAERRARSAEIRAALNERHSVYDAWLRRYRSYGLGDLRAKDLARRRAQSGKLPT